MTDWADTKAAMAIKRAYAHDRSVEYAITKLREKLKARQSLYWHEIDVLLDVAEAAHETCVAEDGDTGLLLDAFGRLIRVMK